MYFYAVNWLAILVASIASMAIGFLWYSPVLFAKPWTRLMGIDGLDKEAQEKMKKEMLPMYTQTFVAAIVSSQEYFDRL